MNDKKAEKKQECVQVVVRCRPFNAKEKKNNRGNIVTLETTLFQVSLTNPLKTDKATKRFTFDAVYDEHTQQRTFYEESCYDLVEGVMEGYNGTIFAYGQTGCGKTHTMQGYNSPPELRGVIPQSFDHIFENIKGSVDTAFLVRCCYLEIYNEEVRDLLCDTGEKKDKLELKEDLSKGVYVKDLSQVVVSDHDGINRLMEQGQKMRTVGATAMNATSSRSHSIFTIVVEMNDVDDAGKDHIRVGKLNLVDLAGSERASKTGASGDRLKEGCKINLSLSALGNVISALVDGKGKYIPYRDSKLTRLLQDSLGGNTKTLMVAAISPADYNYEETLSTLRYANRAKNIQNKPKINEDPKDAMLRQYKEEIEMLKQQLAQASLVTCNLTGTKVENPSAAAAGFVVMDPAKRLSEKASPLVSDVDGITRVRDIPPENPEGECTGAPDSSDVPDTADASKMAADSGESAPEASKDPYGLSCHGGVIVSENDATALPRSEDPDTDTDGKDLNREMDAPQDSLCVSCTSNGGGDDGLGLEGQRVDASGEGRGSPEEKVVVEEKEKVVEKERVVVEEKVVVQEVEVESQKMAERREALENYSKAMEEQRNRLGQELETSVLRADMERQARETMEKKLDILQKKVIGLSSCGWGTRRRRKGPGLAVPASGQGDENDTTGNRPQSKETTGSMDTGDPEVIIARRNAEHRRMQAKLRQKRHKETRLEMERLRALEEKAEVEKEMADMAGQAEEKERRLNKSRKRLEKKLEEARGEIEDLAMEHDREREQLLDSIRNQNRELQLWEQVARQILSPKDIARIWERSEYDEEEQVWVLPRIKPRSSFGGETCRLPLLTRANSVGNGCATHEEDASGQSSGGRRERRRTSARTSVGSGGGQRNASGGAGSAIRARSSGATTGTGSGSCTSRSNGAHGRISLSEDLRPGADEDEEGNRKNKRSCCSSSDRSPRKPGSGAGLKEDGVAHDANVPVTSCDGDTLTRRKGGGMRMACDGEVAAGDIWGDAVPTEDGRYRGLTPPISPGRGISARPTSSGLGHEQSVRPSEHHHQHHQQQQQQQQQEQQEQQEHPRPQSLTRKNSMGEYAESSRTKSRRDPEQWPLCGMIKSNQDGQSRRAGDGSGIEGERCPSRQGGMRPGSRAQDGIRIGQDGQYRQRQHSSDLRTAAVSTLSSAPEDSLFCENDPDVFVSPASNGADRTEITDAGPQRGTLSRRTKNRRRRSGGSSSASPDQQQGRFMEETLKTAGLADSALGTGDLKDNSDYSTSDDVRKQRKQRERRKDLTF